ANDLLAPRQDPKPPSLGANSPADPDVLRQGGDTVADAVTITMPHASTGTTEGYNDDYAGSCAFYNPGAPDVVYRLVPDQDDLVAIDLWGSSYDTKLMVYDVDLNEIACNDDYYADYTSYLEVALIGGREYFIVVDGYGQGHFGDYALAVAPHEPCDLDIPVGAVAEGEPPLQNDVADCYNNGCGTLPCDPPHNWQPLAGDATGALVLHGRSGWFTYSGAALRDTDWFEAVIGVDGAVNVVADAEAAMFMFQLAPLDCNEVAPVMTAEAGPCQEGELTVTGSPGDVIWLWTGPQMFSPPGGGITPAEFDYVLWITGLASEPVAVELRTWTGVKSLYR
ncbi:hypothetical protein DRQ50_12500, partial [bacterium]